MTGEYELLVLVVFLQEVFSGRFPFLKEIETYFF